MVRSLIWRYFQKVDKNYVKCNTCERLITNSGGSTSAMRIHAKSDFARKGFLFVNDLLRRTLVKEDINITKSILLSKHSEIDSEPINTLDEFLKPSLKECNLCMLQRMVLVLDR